ncbi:MAG: RNA-binding protein [Rhizobiales bacterium]|nr:RNA-binding protein [Hyphomicrobiales bacterium]
MTGEPEAREYEVDADGHPRRQCIVTRERASPDELLRFVVGPERRVVPDIAARLPGRGCWVTCRREVVELAVRRRAFARALKTEVVVDADLPALVGQLLRARTLASLSLARKAGEVVLGFMKLEAALTERRIVLLVHASDAGRDGRERLDRRLAALPPEFPGAVLEASGAKITGVDLTRDELSLALGRPNVVHAGMKAGGASLRFQKDFARLRRYEATSSLDCEPAGSASGPDMAPTRGPNTE